MQDSVNRKRLTCPPRARRLAIGALVSAVVVAGCGGSSTSSSSSTTAPRSGSRNSAVRVASSRSTAPSAVAPSGLAFANCMRASGVPSFPDPLAGRGLLFAARPGVNPASPAFKAAQAKCRKLLPAGGPPGAGSTTHPTAQTLAKLLRIAVCMRRHAISQFPDPRTSVPSNFGPGGPYQQLTDFDGAILLFPSTINLQSPAYKQALAACGAPPLGLPH